MDALQHALRNGRMPREIYLDNARQFIAEEFKRKAMRHEIKLIFGRSYHPRGREKIEGYHKALWRGLTMLRNFSTEF